MSNYYEGGTISPYMSYGGYRDDIGSMCIDNIGTITTAIIIIVIMYYCFMSMMCKNKKHSRYNPKSNSSECLPCIKPSLRNMNWLYNSSKPY